MSLYIFISHTYTNNLVWKSYKILSWGYLTVNWTQGGYRVSVHEWEIESSWEGYWVERRTHRGERRASLTISCWVKNFFVAEVESLGVASPFLFPPTDLSPLCQLVPILAAWFCCSVAQSCPTLCDPMDCSLPSFPASRISQGACSNSCPLSWGCLWWRLYLLA